jgi:RND family efflux transporter MFP subunit
LSVGFLAVGLLLAAGCKPAGEAGHGHDHGEPKTAQITVWTDRHEVFAEHRAPVVGQPTQFITHVTDLHTLEPRREGMVKFVLRQGGTVTEHPQAAPARAGIYLPGITFPQAGDWRLSLLIPTDGTNATVDLGTIKVYADAHAAEHADIPDGPEGVSFLKEQQWKILSKTEPAPQRRLVERQRVVARVKARPGGSATLTAPVSGQLMAPANQPLPQPGQKVEAGQLLALLKPNFSEAGAKVAEAQAEFATAKAALAQAEAANERVKKLAADQAKSEREVQEAELAYQAAKARHAAAAGVLGMFRQAEGTADGPMLMELRAPIAGVLDAVIAGSGDTVVAGQPLLTVLNPETVWIEARIPEAGVSRLASAKDAVLQVDDTFLPVTGEGVGRFVALGLEVDAVSRTVPLIYETTNRDGRFRIGQNVTLHVETARAEDAVAIPESSLVEEGGQLIAFVQLSGETFEKREVKTGISDAGFVQVLEGIKAGERVVTKSAYAIRLSSISGVIPAHGHAH